MTTSRNAQVMANKTKSRDPNQLSSPVSHPPIHPDRGLRIHQRRRGVGVGFTCRLRGLDVRSPLRLAERLRQHSRPAGRGFPVAPVDVAVPADVRYLPGTMILETSWGTPTGWIIVRDGLLIGPWHHEDDRSKTYRRTPNDYEAEHILLRTIRCVSGEVQTIVDCEPVLDYGRRTSSGSTPTRATTRAWPRRRASTSG